MHGLWAAAHGVLYPVFKLPKPAYLAHGTHAQVLLHSLDFHLVLVSPFPALEAFCTEAAVPQPTAHRAGAVLNDAYFSDAPLLFPAQLLALGCLALAVAMERGGGAGVGEASSTSAYNQERFREWLLGIGVDIAKVGSCGIGFSRRNGLLRARERADVLLL